MIGMNLIIGVGIILWGIFMVLFAVSALRSGGVSQRARDFVAQNANYEITGVAIPERKLLRGNIIQRTVMPGAIKVIEALGRITPKNMANNMNRQLTIAGNPYNLRAESFFGVRVLFLLVGGGIGVYVLSTGVAGLGRELFGFFSILLIFYTVPVLWLRLVARRRQDDMRLELPDALDILSVCTSAGLSFNQALLRISELWRTALGFEFGRVVSEMEIGISRQDALRNLVDRIDVPELGSFVAVIIQSEKLGMSISDILYSQAEQMRLMRQYRAKEIAQKMPAKMMIPLAFLILPALLFVVLGPAVIFFVSVF